MPIVLVVDDDVSVHECMELLIRCEGGQTGDIELPDELLARPPVLSPRCVVLDVSLPGLSGLELQHRNVNERTYVSSFSSRDMAIYP